MTTLKHGDAVWLDGYLPKGEPAPATIDIRFYVSMSGYVPIRLEEGGQTFKVPISRLRSREATAGGITAGVLT